MTGRVSSSRARLSGLPRVPVLLHCHARAYPGLPDTQPSRRYGRAGWITWHSLSCPASASAGNPCPPGEAWTRGSRLPPSVSVLLAYFFSALGVMHFLQLDIRTGMIVPNTPLLPQAAIDMVQAVKCLLIFPIFAGVEIFLGRNDKVDQ